MDQVKAQMVSAYREFSIDVRLIVTGLFKVLLLPT